MIPWLARCILHEQIETRHNTSLYTFLRIKLQANDDYSGNFGHAQVVFKSCFYQRCIQYSRVKKSSRYMHEKIKEMHFTLMKNIETSIRSIMSTQIMHVFLLELRWIMDTSF